MNKTAMFVIYVLISLFRPAWGLETEAIIASHGCLGPCLRLARVGPDTNCTATCRFYNNANANLLARADGVVGFPGGVSRKHTGQVLFAYWQESAANTPATLDAHVMRQFNYTYSYRQDAEIRRDSGGISEMLYEMFARFRSREMPAPIDYKSKLQFPLASTMISSGGKTPNARGRVIELLEENGISTSHYGAYRRNARFSATPQHSRFEKYKEWHLQRAAHPAALNKIKAISNHLFHLAFENSDCPWYHTEKVFQALAAGTIPVYLGARTIGLIMPRHSFIEVKHYKTAQQLARHMLYIAHNQTIYQSYFAWRGIAEKEGLPSNMRNFATRHTLQQVSDNMCKMCKMVTCPGQGGNYVQPEQCEKPIFE